MFHANFIWAKYLQLAIIYARGYIKPCYNKDATAIGPDFFLQSSMAKEVMPKLYNALIRKGVLLPLENEESWYQEAIYEYVISKVATNTTQENKIMVCKILHALGYVMENCL